MVRDWREAGLDAADRALCAFAEVLTAKQEPVTEARIDELRRHGFDDTAIHDAVQVIAYFNYITRVADGLGVQAEPFIAPWGVDAP